MPMPKLGELGIVGDSPATTGIVGDSPATTGIVGDSPAG